MARLKMQVPSRRYPDQLRDVFRTQSLKPAPRAYWQPRVVRRDPSTVFTQKRPQGHAAIVLARCQIPHTSILERALIEGRPLGTTSVAEASVAIPRLRAAPVLTPSVRFMTFESFCVSSMRPSKADYVS
jgi:hypothetical protein